MRRSRIRPVMRGDLRGTKKVPIAIRSPNDHSSTQQTSQTNRLYIRLLQQGRHIPRNLSCRLTIRSEPSPPAIQPDVLLDTYFSRCHGKAYYILDETTTRQRMQLNQIPSYLVFAIYSVSAR